MDSEAPSVLPPSILSAAAASSSDYYWHSYAHFSIHEEMLKDRVRTESYRRAIQANDGALVRGKVVLDVGCGTGILSLFAAQAGAKKVYAIECADIADQAKIIVKKNGFENVVTILKGKVEEIELPEKVDVIISEWMGYFLMYESMLSSVIFARDRWLKPNGLLLPDKCTLFIHGIEDSEYRDSKINWWNNVYGFNMSCIGEIAISEPLVDCVEPHQQCTTDFKLIEFDINKVQQKDLTWKADFEVFMTRADMVHAFVTYFDTEFTSSGVSFSTGPSAKYTHWKQAVMYTKDIMNMSKGEKISGSLECKPSEKNPRDLDLTFAYKANGKYTHADHTQLFFMR